MGGGHSIESTQKSVVKALTEIISQSMQKAGNTVDVEQTVKLDCNEFNAAKNDAYLKCLEAIDASSSTRQDQKYKEKADFCVAFFENLQCKVNDIELGQLVNVSLTEKQSNELKTTIEQEIKSKLETKIQQETGLFEFGSETKSEVDVLVESIAKSIASSLQVIYNSIGARQTIESKGGSISFVKADQAVDAVQTFVQENKQVNEAVVKLSSKVQAELEKTSGTINWALILGIVGGVILLVAVVALIVSFVRRR